MAGSWQTSRSWDSSSSLPAKSTRSPVASGVCGVGMNRGELQDCGDESDDKGKEQLPGVVDRRIPDVADEEARGQQHEKPKTTFSGFTPVA